MQPLAPAAFPKRVKRFQSYSMTPLDSEMDIQNSPLYSTTTGSSKSHWQTPKRSISRYPPCLNTNPDTNQFSPALKSNSIDTDRINFKHLQSSQLQNGNQLSNSIQKSLIGSDHKKHRKMVTSDIFVFSSMINKNSLSEQKNTPNFISRSNNGEKNSYESQIIQKQLTRTNNKFKELRVPSFLLKKKKQIINVEYSNGETMTERNLVESSPIIENQSTAGQNRVSFKKPSIQIIQNKTENDNFESDFHPPSSGKIAFSKATASTLYTDLPRQESRRTFRDFDEIMEMKQIQNSMEESDNSNNIHNQFQNLFGRGEQAKTHTGDLVSEIAELFSDEDLQSEEFNEELKLQLDDLF